MTTSEANATTDNGVASNTSDKITSAITVDQAEAIYLKRQQDARKQFESSMQRGKEAKKPTDDDEVRRPDRPLEDDEEEDTPRSERKTDDDEGDDTSTREGDDEAEVKYADDTAKVRVKVGDEELVVDVKDLKRLYGQESALTKRSQEIAAKGKEFEAKVTKAVTALDHMLTSAKKAYEPYEKIDWAQAQRSLSPADYTQLRNDALEVHNNIKFLNEELDAQMNSAKEYAETEMRRLAAEAGKQLKDQAGPHYIEGWSKETYAKLRDFASEAGLKTDVFDNIVDPAAIKLIHDAMQYRAEKAKAKSVITKAKAKVVSERQLSTKSTGSEGPRDKAAMERLKQSGSVDDAAAVYLQRMKARREASGR